MGQIAKINGIDNPDISVAELSAIQIQYKEDLSKSSSSNKVKKFSLFDLFRYPSLRWMTLNLIFMDCVFMFQYLTPTLMLGQFNFNIFLNGAAIESAQLFAAIIGVLTIYKIPRRMAGSVSFSIIVICSLILIFVWDQNAAEETTFANKMNVLSFVFVIELTVSNAFNFYAVYLN